MEKNTDNKFFWGPSNVENPDLKADLKKYFFKSVCDDNVIEKIIEKHYDALNVICDRYEFVCKLQDIKKILQKHTRTSNRVIEKEGYTCIVNDLHTMLEGYEFNGVPFDIDALCQYLMLTIIDKITGDKPPTFPVWLSNKMKQEHIDSVTRKDLNSEAEIYYNEHGLKRNFIKVFDLISSDLQEKIINIFVVAKIGVGEIDKTSLEKWDTLSDNEKFKKITEYLYNEIRCTYTHSCTRTFLNNRPILFSLPSKKELLLNKVDPKICDLISVLQEVVIELVNIKYTIGDC